MVLRGYSEAHANQEEVAMTEESPENPRSLRRRGADAARRVTDPLASAASALTGKGVEQEVAEYTETFTQVALGLHEDVADLSRRVAELEKQATELFAATADSVPRVEGSRTRKLIWLAIGIAAIALAAAVAALALAT